LVPAHFVTEQGVEPQDGTLVVLTPSTNIANPGREIGNGYQFFVEPREIGEILQLHHPGLAFHAQSLVLKRFAVH